MIILNYQNNSILVFNREDWSILRKEHRIIGQLMGCLPTLPRQNIFLGLPMVLMPEQALLLAEKELAEIVQWQKLTEIPNTICKEVFEKDIKDALKIQNENYKIKRKLEIEQNLDKMMMRKNQNLTKEQILQLEIDKIPDVTTDNMLLPLMTDIPNYLKDEPLILPVASYKEKVNNTRYRIFGDLWNRGYYVTDGLAFGGDFLIYKGDPSVCHANLIIKCLSDYSYSLRASEIVALGRLGNAVKKKLILASVNNEIIQYLTLKWDGDE